MQDSFRRVGAVALLGAVICLNSGKAQAIQCAIFARSVTGLELSGDAWQWWNHAKGTYARGNVPKPGAVLVFMRSAPMRHGHVSVVRRIVNSREILVDHANWGTRGAVSRNVAVLDDSPNNDWSSVRVAFGGGYGRTNPTYGFIYDASASSANMIEAANQASDTADQADDRDDVLESAPRHRNHRWIKLAIAHGGAQHGRTVWARQATGSHSSLTLVSYEPASPARRAGHGQSVAAAPVASPHGGTRAARHTDVPAHGRTAAAKAAGSHHDPHAHGTAVASAGKHKARSRG